MKAASIRLGLPVEELRVNDGTISGRRTVGAAQTSYWEVTTDAMFHLEAGADV